MELEAIKELPAVKEWAEKHKISGERLDAALKALIWQGEAGKHTLEEMGGVAPIVYAKDPIGDCMPLQIDIFGHVHARDDVAREGISKILKILTSGEIGSPVLADTLDVHHGQSTIEDVMKCIESVLRHGYACNVAVVGMGAPCLFNMKPTAEGLAAKAKR